MSESKDFLIRKSSKHSKGNRKQNNSPNESKKQTIKILY